MWLTGDEPFHHAGRDTGFSALSFWQWSASNLLGNALRGEVAEYLVSCALGDTSNPRTEWDAYDVQTNDGIKVEVKPSAYLQSWKQERLSPLKFSIGRTYGWDARTNTNATVNSRQADVYVFCVLAHRDKATVDPLDIDQWEFYVVATRQLDEHLGDQKTAALGTLVSAGAAPTQYDELSQAVNRAAGGE